MVVGVADLLWTTEAVVKNFVRSIVTLNLQKVSDLLLMGPCWPFSIAFDSATNDGDDYLDLLVLLFSGGVLSNFHVLAVQMTESHTGEVMSQIVKTILFS